MKKDYKHGLSRTPEYRAWLAMMHRCYSPRTQSYPRYGGRGIAVCKEWRDDVRQFIADVGPKPSPEHSIDRIDNDGNYEPGNVRWVDIKTQNDNRSVSRKLTAFGRTQPVADWCAEFGVKYTTLLARVERWGWSVEKALMRRTEQANMDRHRDQKGRYV